MQGKHCRSFVGKTLYHPTIIALSLRDLISQLVINTDSPTIVDDAKREFPHVRLIERPKEMCADTIPMHEMLLHDIEHIEAE